MFLYFWLFRLIVYFPCVFAHFCVSLVLSLVICQCSRITGVLAAGSVGLAVVVVVVVVVAVVGVVAAVVVVIVAVAVAVAAAAVVFAVDCFPVLLR